MFDLVRRTAGKDDGVIGVLFVLLFAAGSLVGLLALSVDVGSIYAERRVVQNSARSEEHTSELQSH